MAHERLIPIKEVPERVHELTGSINPKVDTIREWCRNGYLRSRKIGGRVMVETDSIREYLLGKEDENR